MGRRKILVIDDNPVDRHRITTLLTKNSEDFEVIEAESGRACFEQLEAYPDIALLLLDVRLGEDDGIDICRRIKRQSKWEHIPVVLISAVQTDDKSIAEGLDAGADGYLTKPVEGNPLRAWLRATMRIYDLQAALGATAVPETGAEEMLDHFSRLSHAINNPLQSVMAAADLLSLDMDSDEEAQASLQEIVHSAERIAEMVAAASRMAKAEKNRREQQAPPG